MVIMNGEFDHIFTDAELQDLLLKVEQGEGGGALADMFSADGGPLPLQFLPPPPPGQLATSIGDASGTTSAPSSAMAPGPVAPSGFEPGGPMPALGPGPLGLATDAATAALAALHTSSSSLNAPIAALPSPTAFHGAMSLAPARSAKGQSDKPHVSHSTVEKQRRDRINSLIDELRELVPPSKATMAAAQQAGGKDANANSEARRPKHVVLADTISLLKQLQIKQGASLTALLNGPVAAASGAGRPGANGHAPGSPPTSSNGGGGAAGPSHVPPPPLVVVKEEPGVGGGAGNHLSPSNSNSKGSVSSHEDMEMKDTAAPKLPHIPIQPTQLAGVVVERGPDCMYVQVKCRDRKGLLVDIINALKQLPLEVRTAAVTTTKDGLVRDVFEVCVDDRDLQPEDVQNMVHEALYEKFPSDSHKRVRC